MALGAHLRIVAASSYRCSQCLRSDDLYPKIELHEVAQRHPDVVLAPSEPYPFSTRHLAELESVATTTFVDGKDLFWWGVRTHGAMERLVRLVAGLSPRNRG